MKIGKSRAFQSVTKTFRSEVVMRRVYLCSRYSSDDESERRNNAFRALSFMVYAKQKGYAPYVPHLLYTQVADDHDRTTWLMAALSFLQGCDELWVLVDQRGRSSGMNLEIGKARRDRIPTRFFRLTEEKLFVEVKEEFL